MTQTERLTSALAGRYRVERHLGDGGMATVYLARDLKHNRPVALKVLRPELAAVVGAERFLKEIEVTARLQHANILPLFDSGEADTFLYYVMPFVDGEPLRARIARERQLPVDDVVAITRGVAAALDYAHRQGVIHRDIKPENILLHDGQALVADFGIALAISQAGAARVTETGLSLGTPQYMSPEQATGERALDGRTDIYSLGAVAYEMLTGEPPHTGSSVQAIIARLLSSNPVPVTQLRPLVPPHVDAAVQRALARTPADRFTTAAELAAALTNPGFTLAATAAGSAPAGPRSRERLWRRVAIAMSVVVAGLGGSTAWSHFRLPPAAGRSPLYAEVYFPSDHPLLLYVYKPVVLSPDGSMVAYTGLADGKQMLIVKRLDEFQAHALPGTEEAMQPFFSPDSKWLGFFAGSRLKKVPVAGGPVMSLAGASNPRGGTWTYDGRIVFTGSSAGGLIAVSENGGDTTTIVKLDSTASAVGVTSYRWPSILPDSTGLVFVAFNNLVAENEIRFATLDGRRQSTLTVGGTQPSVTADGHLLYVNADGTLMGARFNARRDTIDDVTPLVADVALDHNTSAAFYSVSNNGSLVYVAGSIAKALVRVDRNGVERVIQDSLRAPATPRISSDGSRVVMEAIGHHTSQIVLYDLARHAGTPITFTGIARYPSWSPAGDRILFSWLTGRGANRSLFEVTANAATTPRLVLAGGGALGELFEGAWLPDGRQLVVRGTTRMGGRDISIATAGAADSSRPLANTPSDEKCIAVSPDGRFVAYVSDESESPQVYVRSTRPDGGKWQVSRTHGVEPVWSRDGRELFYRDLQHMLVVSVETEPSFRLGAARTLFRDQPYYRTGDRAQYDVDPTGTWFVMTRGLTDKSHVLLVLNWAGALRGGGQR